MKLYPHQQKIVDENPLKTLLALGTGVGKTITALSLAEGSILVIAPKQQCIDMNWEKTAEQIGKPGIMVISKEAFRRDNAVLSQYDTVIIDEAHYITSGLYPNECTRNKQRVPKMSQLFEAVLTYLAAKPPKRLYLLTATPKSKPMSVFATALLLGRTDISRHAEFRDTFYTKFTLNHAEIYTPRKDADSNTKLAELTRSLGYFGRLQDYEDVPEQTFRTVYFERTQAQKDTLKSLTELDPLARAGKERCVDNGVLYDYEIKVINDKEEVMVKATRHISNEKLEYILERAEEFPKMLIFATYTAQIHAIVEALQKTGYDANALTGQTKDRKELLLRAERNKEGILVVQSSISAGWEWKSCPVVLFASLSNKFVDYEQSLGRVQRSGSVKKNLYLHLVTKGGADERCYKSISSGQDFQEALYA